MKKFKILTIFMITLLITGCAKLDANMKINKDKSMDYEIIMAFEQSIADQASFDEDSIKQAEKNGFTVTEYNENSMKGYKFVKHIKDIDSISTSDDINGSLDVDSDNKYIFTVKKGIIKNRYIAKLTTTNTDLSGLKSLQTNDSLNTTETIDYGSLSNMEAKFEVTLPYKAIKNNAQNTNDKTLTWDLLTFKGDAIEFEFELYNYTNIIIIAIALFIILVIIVIILNKASKKTKDDDSTISVDNNFGQADNISNVEDINQAQAVWNDNIEQSNQINNSNQNVWVQPQTENPTPNMTQVPNQNPMQNEWNNQNNNQN